MATKYVSSLTGPEMDAALIDMAYHNSEAYAVGTRNGVEVGSSDVTYHNNSKYYAEQVYGYTDRAEDAAARAEAAVPAGTAGAVFFDRAQSLTTAQQSQARANIMAGGTNPNLLDNAYFVGGGSQLGDGVFPINQRGLTSYPSSGPCIDRWRTDGGFTVSSSGVSQTFSAAAFQIVDASFFARLLGKTFTLSLLLTDGTIKSGQITLPNSVPASAEFYSAFNDGTHYAASILYPGGNGQLFRFGGDNIAAVKMEYGTVSTLANDVPPDFWEELEKCQHYLWVVSFPSGSILSTGYASGDFFITDIILPTTIREGNLALTFNANVLIIGNGTAVVAASVIGVTRHGNHLRTYINPASALTNQNLYAFVTSADTVMVVSAEL